ncbi:MAG: hypothetical protein CMP09_02800 [Yangia sp.]|nr:hypothetical protein [Salipiger sp.]
MVSASSFDTNILNAVVASIAPGESPSITITPGGKLDRVIQKAITLGRDPKWDETTDEPGTRSVAQTAPGTTPATDDPSEGVVGAGFYVSSDGHVITNAHVVQGCQTIMVDEEPADMIDKSDTFDLAILKGDSSPTFATFAEAPARLNSDVTAVGFPYGGILGGLNVTRGSVSAMKGFDNNAVEMQITAPVQSGNSGGPLLGADGAVVGVVVSKLDAVQVASVLGDLPQNVNYAVRGELAKLFLSQNGVTPTTSERGAALAPEDLADRAKAYTVFIECER